jgi:hypothetical protein
MNETELIEVALKKYPKAKRIAVENFVMSAPNDPIANSVNLMDDTRSYKWNSDTYLAIKYCLKSQGKFITY